MIKNLIVLLALGLVVAGCAMLDPTTHEVKPEILEPVKVVAEVAGTVVGGPSLGALFGVVVGGIAAVIGAVAGVKKAVDKVRKSKEGKLVG